MGAYQDYIALISGTLKAEIKDFGGTIMPPLVSDYPTQIGVKSRGASFPVPTIDVLADIPLDILELGMEVRVVENNTKYFLATMPVQRISEIIDYNISNYWQASVENNVSSPEVSTTLQSQYSPSFNNEQPLFEPKDITREAYNAGYATTAGFDASDPNLLIWESEFDSSKGHIWIRQRLKETDDWGIPVKIFGEGYETGQYISNIFKWVLKTDPAPSAPPSVVNGVSNIEPAGWDNTPDDYPDTDYNTSVVTYDLYRSTAVISAYNKLKSSWTVPIKISTDPNLTRYGNTPGSIDFFNDNFWRGYYTAGLDTHMATRPLLSGTSGEVDAVYGDWSVIKIDNESGEYPDIVFKAFPIGTPPLLADRPTSESGMGGVAPNDAVDAPFSVANNELLYASKSTKFFDGSLKVPWSAWYRFDGLDTIRSVIVPLTADIFKKGTDGIITPSSIVLNPEMYRGNTILVNGLTIQWFKDDVEIVDGVTENHAINQTNFNLTISPDGVDGIAKYELRITFETIVYKSFISIADVTDGVRFSVQINSPSGLVYKNSTGSKNFNAEFFINGFVNNNNVTFVWTLDGQSISNPAITPITGAQINGQAILKVVATFVNVEYVDTITLTDLIDGLATIRVFHTGEANPPDFLSNLSLSDVLSTTTWTTNYVGAVWMREYNTSTNTWGGETRIKGEVGSNNSGFNKNAFINSINKPTATGLTVNLLPTGTGWTDAPTVQGESQSTWMSLRIFAKKQSTTDVALTSANWDPVNEWSDPIRLVKASTGVDAEDGANAWTPLIVSEVIDDNTIYLKIADYIGGEGIKPTVGLYIGDGALVATQQQATNFGPKNLRPMYAVRSKLSPNYTAQEVSITQAQGNVEMGSLKVENTWNQQRAFIVVGSIGVSNDDQPDHFYMEMLRSVSESGDANLLIDHDSVSTDFTSISPSYKAKLRCQAIIYIPANSSRTVRIRLRQIGGVAGIRDPEGAIEAFGI